MLDNGRLREKQRLHERHAVLSRPLLILLPVLITLAHFCHWKWACKTRHWGRRPRRDWDLQFYVWDETETFPDFLETETTPRHSKTASRDRDFMPNYLPFIACCWPH